MVSGGQRRAVLVVFALTVLTYSAYAQSTENEFDRLCFFDRLFSEPTVGPDFSLKLSFHGRPIAGASIAIENSKGNVAATAKTNPKGVAHFTAIPPGEYYPSAPDGLLFPSGSLVIEVKAGNPAGERVKVEWPADPSSIRSAKGRFTTSDLLDDPDIPMQNQRVELLDLRTATLIESAQTNANGEYEFKTAQPGLYALRVTLPRKGEPGSENHDLAVEVDPAASDYALPDMKVVQSNCNGVQFYRRSESDDGTWDQQ
jgi:hypothetical protein